MTAGNALSPKRAAGGGGVAAAAGVAAKKAESTKGSAAPAGAPPQAPPPFTVGDLRRAIPAHLFERSAFWSFVHLFRDFALVGIIAAANYALQTSAAVPEPLKWAAWPVYGFLAGAYLTGVWVVAHECGHQAFSSSRLLNDSVGLVLHSALLVPYHSWAISHAHHHANTCSMENDEVFVPATRPSFSWAEAVDESPVASLVGLAKMLLVGWPGYLLANFSGPEKYRGKDNSHFSPVSALFSRRQAPLIVLSDIGLLAAAAALYAAVRAFGGAAVALWYVLPYLFVNANLVTITYLQHTDVYVPHYRGEAFTWLRGALSTVDRSFGWLLDDAFHHIADSHVAHHLFHTMPWYNAVEATPHLQKALGEYYMSDATPVPTALFRSWRACKFVEEEGDVLYYRGFADLATKPKAA